MPKNQPVAVGVLDLGFLWKKIAFYDQCRWTRPVLREWLGRPRIPPRNEKLLGLAKLHLANAVVKMGHQFGLCKCNDLRSIVAFNAYKIANLGRVEFFGAFTLISAHISVSMSESAHVICQMQIHALCTIVPYLEVQDN